LQRSRGRISDGETIHKKKIGSPFSGTSSGTDLSLACLRQITLKYGRERTYAYAQLRPITLIYHRFTVFAANSKSADLGTIASPSGGIAVGGGRRKLVWGTVRRRSYFGSSSAPGRLMAGHQSNSMDGSHFLRTLAEHGTATKLRGWADRSRHQHPGVITLLDLGPTWVHSLPNTIQKEGTTRRTNLNETTG
jgi:hypothetical protein